MSDSPSPLTPNGGTNASGGMIVVAKGNGMRNVEEPRLLATVTAELLDDNLAAFLLAGGVDVKGLLTLLNEFLDFSPPTGMPYHPNGGVELVDPMEVLESWYRRDGIEDFIERLRHDSRRVGKAADAATVRESPKALGEGQDK